MEKNLAYSVAGGITAAVFCVIYYGFGSSPGSLDAAFCISYTFFVLGFAFADENSRLFSSEPARPINLVLPVHLGFLTLVLGVNHFNNHILPSLPAWMIDNGALDFKILVTIVLALGIFEKWLLFRDPDRNPGPRPCKTVKGSPSGNA
jgi:hypothetical protein